METKQFTITKRIAKQGNQAVIIMPSLLDDKLRPGIIVKLNIEIIGEQKDEKNNNF